MPGTTRSYFPIIPRWTAGCKGFFGEKVSQGYTVHFSAKPKPALPKGRLNQGRSASSRAGKSSTHSVPSVPSLSHLAKVCSFHAPFPSLSVRTGSAHVYEKLRERLRLPAKNRAARQNRSGFRRAAAYIGRAFLKVKGGTLQGKGLAGRAVGPRCRRTGELSGQTGLGTSFEPSNLLFVHWDLPVAGENGGEAA